MGFVRSAGRALERGVSGLADAVGGGLLGIGPALSVRAARNPEPAAILGSGLLGLGPALLSQTPDAQQSGAPQGGPTPQLPNMPQGDPSLGVLGMLPQSHQQAAMAPPPVPGGSLDNLGSFSKQALQLAGINAVPGPVPPSAPPPQSFQPHPPSIKQPPPGAMPMQQPMPMPMPRNAWRQSVNPLEVRARQQFALRGRQ